MGSTKNILLINPWIYDFTAYDFWIKPLGLLYMASIIKKYAKVRLSFIDCLDRGHPEFEEKLKIKNDGRGPFFKQEVTKPELLKEVPRKYSRYGIPVSLFEHEMEKTPTPDLVLFTCVMTYWYPGVRFAVELVRKKFGNVPILLGGIYATLMPEHAKRETGVLPKRADPLLHNKLVFPYLRGDFSLEEFENINKLLLPGKATK